MAQAAPTLPTGSGTAIDRRTKLSPGEQARVIHLLFIDELSVEIVARRFDVGSTTIRRIRTAYYETIDSRKATVNANGR
jgi:transposase-like protein